MKADILTLKALFQKDVRYVIPTFQRPYVWNQEDQWKPPLNWFLRLWSVPARLTSALEPLRAEVQGRSSCDGAFQSEQCRRKAPDGPTYDDSGFPRSHRI